ncbi:MAG TPA: alpha-L-arabinofuranosidase C-terminal domain-containing protein, partial [Phycisphaerae bacterium]|nr:alpha-L-arabinofuranosidase C-terminal domain-containing protein [Phycisphaerae bacterium]
PAGRVGIGTQRCAAEFKDIRIQQNDRTLLASSFSGSDTAGWSKGDSWRGGDEVYQQTDAGASTTSFAGNNNWSDYTVTLKARRTDGAGALVFTVCDDNTHAAASRAQWLLGAQIGGPTVADKASPEFVLQTLFAEQDTLVAHTPGTLETNRWYDIKIAVHGDSIECSLDGKIIHSAQILQRRVPTLFTSATRDEKTGATILKVVNPGAAPMTTQVHLQGAGVVQSLGQAIVLSGDLNAEDNMATPTAVIPQTEQVRGIGRDFDYTFKPHSFTILRLATSR